MPYVNRMDSIESTLNEEIDDPTTYRKKVFWRLAEELKQHSVRLHQQQEKGVNFVNISSRCNNRVFPINLKTNSQFRPDSYHKKNTSNGRPTFKPTQSS